MKVAIILLQLVDGIFNAGHGDLGVLDLFLGHLIPKEPCELGKTFSISDYEYSDDNCRLSKLVGNNETFLIVSKLL